MFWDSTIVILFPAILLSLIAQITVSSSFAKYSRVRNNRGLAGADAARAILEDHGIYNVRIEHISGNLTDHYDPRANVIRLSDSVYSVNSVAAVGVAAHEAGHAVQYSESYFPIKVRSAIIPVTRFGSSLSAPIFMLGVVFSLDFLIAAGILLFCGVVFFQLVTLPVEFNASRRALKSLRNGNILEKNEIKGTRKVLTAAAMTYVAAMLTSLLNLIRLLLISGRRRRR